MARSHAQRPSGDAHDPHGMQALLDKFCNALRVQNYSETTVVSRITFLANFIRWADERGITRPNEVTKPILERYQRFLFTYRKANGEPLTFRTQNNYLVAVRAWFKWLTRHNHILYNPASELELPKLEQRLPKFILSAREADQVINQPNVEEPLGVRDRAILETFYSTGIRRRELAGLRVYDVDAERCTLTVRQGKNKKDRVLPIGERALRWVQKYLQDVRPGLLIGDQGRDVLFLTELGEAFTPDRLSQMVRRYVDAAELGKRGSCHLFRHTMATLMLENGADIRFVQAMLGHAHLNTTQIYTQVSIKKLQAIHAATHPAARLPRSTKPPARKDRTNDDGTPPEQPPPP